MSDTTITTAANSKQARRVWLSSFIGGSIEFYDFSIYSTASSLVFAQLFFSGIPPALGLVASFATLAIGYAARPIGGILFGHFGDKIGRKRTLIMTIVLMGIATFLIGVLPTTATLGVAAPILLVLLRLVQGLSVGGEWGGSVVLTTEHSSTKRRAFMGSATLMGSAAGLLLGFTAFGIVIPATGENFLVWGWRLPFLFTVVLFAIALYMRFRITESPAMLEQRAKIAADKAAGKKFEVPIGAVLRKNWRAVLLGALAFTGPFLVQNLMLTFFVAYNVTRNGLAQGTVINIGMAALFLCMIGIPIAAGLADRFGRRRIMAIGVALAGINALFILPLLNTGQVPFIFISYLLVFLIHSLCIAPIAAIYSEVFPTKNRYTGVSITYQLASLLAGGLGPLAAASLAAAGANAWVITGGAAAVCAISLISLMRLRRSDGVDLRTVGDEPSETIPVPATPAVVG